MIDKAILKKFNLKAVPFSCIGEGQTFILEVSFADYLGHDPHFYARRLTGGSIFFADQIPAFKCGYRSDYHPSCTVYVPVWRPC